MILKGDCLALVKTLEDNSVDCIISDPPYFLGSKWIIDNTGQYIFEKRGRDFLGKWEVGDGYWWNELLREFYRVLKPNGYCVLFSMDRQSDMVLYNARLNNFLVKQRLYWMYLSNFPKVVDASLAIDKRLKQKREVIGMRNPHLDGGKRKRNDVSKFSNLAGEEKKYDKLIDGMKPVTGPSSDLAKKYDGYKYSICPLKQIFEEILVLQKNG